MALHTDLAIYRTGSELLGLAYSIQEQMPRGMKRFLGEKILQHCTRPAIPTSAWRARAASPTATRRASPALCAHAAMP